MTLVMPNIDMGILRSLSPRHISKAVSDLTLQAFFSCFSLWQVYLPVIVPPTMLMLTELAPPPKKRVTIRVAKFGAVADGISQMRNKMYAPKYPGMRPVFSVNGTKSKGKTAAPTFHDAVAQYSHGKLSWLIPNSASIWTLPEP